MEEEYARCKKKLQAEVREVKEELARAKGDCKEKYSKLEGAIDEELDCLFHAREKWMLSQNRRRRL